MSGNVANAPADLSASLGVTTPQRQFPERKSYYARSGERVQWRTQVREIKAEIDRLAVESMWAAL